MSTNTRIKEPLHSVEDVEINLAYMLAMALERLIDDIERRLNAVGASFTFDKKRRFNNIVKACKEVKRNSDLMDQIDYAEAFKGREDQWQGYLENGLYLDRILLLLCDRITANNDTYHAIENLLRRRKTAGIITERDLDRFRLRKYKGGDA